MSRRNQERLTNNEELTTHYFYDKQGNLIMAKGRKNRLLRSSDRTFGPSDRANTGTSDQAFSLSDDNNVLNQEIYKAVRGEKLEVSKENQELYFVRDYLGNIKSIFDNNGNMLYYRLYDEFGNESDSGQAAQESLNLGAAQTPAFGFTSREFDEIADLYFYRSRYYDPQIGRFTQRDKFNEAGFITGNCKWQVKFPIVRKIIFPILE